MKCLPVFSFVQNSNNISTNKKSYRFSPRYLNQPAYDTVSFGMSAQKYAKPAVTAGRDVVEKKVSTDIKHVILDYQTYFWMLQIQLLKS